VKNSEGTVEQAGSKGHDAQTIATNTLEGAGIGGLAGWGAGDARLGTGIGAGAGAAAGILTTLLTRGNDIVFPPGTTLEMELTRSLTIKEGQLSGMPTFTGIVDPQKQVPVAGQQSGTQLPSPKN
jgi:type IV secretion system protein VirB10